MTDASKVITDGYYFPFHYRSNDAFYTLLVIPHFITTL